MIPNITPVGIDRQFRIRKLEFTTYEVEYREIAGQLRIINIPVKIIEQPKSTLQGSIDEQPNYMIKAQFAMGFTNRGRRGPPSQDPSKGENVDITNYVVWETERAPWNEFIVAGDPAYVLRQRTTLTKLLLIKDKYTQDGDPSINAAIQSTFTVSKLEAQEAGLS
ncbi:MAG: hypothetical protein JRN26_01105 [Nitrososphaerota archaeon]|jgi:hypothetical protein|nr:hypothetical protein [Nitrososphaerota archaeon]MDG6932921.1 hypothetical protein [Nitrososphaerota archaeon]MDG6935477.1 hypothetical protein [Nitrososphaerota archaeon]MDG6943610.1 hypothetical protein [Nitrososphaerota archaeon]